MGFNEKMTALADEVRELSGTTEEKSLDALISDTTSANSEITEQTNLIDQIRQVVDTLPEAGGEVTLQEKTVTPTTSLQNVTADSGYDGLSKVTVNAMSIATQATPSITIDSSGLITATTAQSAGYVSAGTKSATKQLSTQAAKTITPSSSEQTAVDKDVYTTGVIKVAAIPNTYVKPSATKDATTYTPSTSDQTIASGTYLTGVQIIKGDANLVAGNIKSGVSIFGVNGTLEEDAGDPAENYEDEILNGTLVNYTNSTVAKLRNGAFVEATSLKTVNLPNCSHIGQEAFCNCTSLTTASFETCISMASSAFQGCTKLTTISFPAYKSIYWAGFSTCTSLSTINLPNCTYLGGRAFQGCTKLATASLPLCKYIYSSTFQSCKSLATISLPNITMIGSTAFGSCTNLKTVYLAGSTLCTLSGSNAFTGTGITSTSGSVYVNASLVDSYKAATNWAYFTNIIHAIAE